MAEPEPTKTLHDIIFNSKDLTVLASLIKAAKLEETFKNPGTFTVFAPIDEAFDKLDPESEKIFNTTTDAKKLASFLNYHVLPSKLAATDIKAGNYKTIHGKDLSIAVSTYKTINFTSRIIQNNLKASN